MSQQQQRIRQIQQQVNARASQPREDFATPVHSGMNLRNRTTKNIILSDLMRTVADKNNTTANDNTNTNDGNNINTDNDNEDDNDTTNTDTINANTNTNDDDNITANNNNGDTDTNDNTSFDTNTDNTNTNDDDEDNIDANNNTENTNTTANNDNPTLLPKDYLSDLLVTAFELVEKLGQTDAFRLSNFINNGAANKQLTKTGNKKRNAYNPGINRVVKNYPHIMSVDSKLQCIRAGQQIPGSDCVLSMNLFFHGPLQAWVLANQHLLKKQNGDHYAVTTGDSQATAMTYACNLEILIAAHLMPLDPKVVVDRATAVQLITNLIQKLDNRDVRSLKTKSATNIRVTTVVSAKEYSLTINEPLPWSILNRMVEHQAQQRCSENWANVPNERIAKSLEVIESILTEYNGNCRQLSVINGTRMQQFAWWHQNLSGGVNEELYMRVFDINKDKRGVGNRLNRNIMVLPNKFCKFDSQLNAIESQLFNLYILKHSPWLDDVDPENMEDYEGPVKGMRKTAMRVLTHAGTNSKNVHDRCTPGEPAQKNKLIKAAVAAVGWRYETGKCSHPLRQASNQCNVNSGVTGYDRSLAANRAVDGVTANQAEHAYRYNVNIPHAKSLSYMCGPYDKYDHYTTESMKWLLANHRDDCVHMADILLGYPLSSKTIGGGPACWPIDPTQPFPPGTCNVQVALQTMFCDATYLIARFREYEQDYPLLWLFGHPGSPCNKNAQWIREAADATNNRLRPPPTPQPTPLPPPTPPLQHPPPLQQPPSPPQQPPSPQQLQSQSQSQLPQPPQPQPSIPPLATSYIPKTKKLKLAMAKPPLTDHKTFIPCITSIGRVECVGELPKVQSSFVKTVEEFHRPIVFHEGMKWSWWQLEGTYHPEWKRSPSYRRGVSTVTGKINKFRKFCAFLQYYHYYSEKKEEFTQADADAFTLEKVRKVGECLDFEKAITGGVSAFMTDCDKNAGTNEKLVYSFEVLDDFRKFWKDTKGKTEKCRRPRWPLFVYPEI